jgi:hypothetical protein
MHQYASPYTLPPNAPHRPAHDAPIVLILMVSEAFVAEVMCRNSLL